MSNTSIQLKKSGQTGNTPSNLAFGEIAINYADGKLYYKDDTGSIDFISNQSSFDTINANNSLILATGVSDTLSFVAGNNISIDTNTTTKTITINSTGTATDQPARDTSNAAFLQANAAFSKANSVLSGFRANTLIVANGTGYLSNSNAEFSLSNNTLYVPNANISNEVIANSLVFYDGTRLNSATGISANTAATANVTVYARVTNVTTGTYFPIVTDTTITGSDTLHYSSNDFVMYAANNTFRATGNVWAGQFLTVGSNIPVVNSTGHWVGQTISAGSAGSANTANVAINARITNVTTGTYFPIVTDTTITGSDTLHYSSNDFLMYAANNTFRATGNVWAGTSLTVGTNIPVVNSTGHWVGQTINAIDSFARSTGNSAGLYANGAFIAANTADSKAVTSGSYANAAFAHANAAFNVANTAGGGGTGNASFIFSGTSNVYFATANGNIVANVGGNTIATVTNTGIQIAGSGGNLAGANNIYANTFIANNTITISGSGGDISGASNITGNNIIAANGVTVAGLNVVPHLQSAFLAANTPSHVANSAALYANGAFIQANAAFLRANTPDAIANSAALYANGAFIQANAAFGSQNTTGNYANSAYAQANTATTNAATADSKAVTAGSYANSAFSVANTDVTNINITGGVYGNSSSIPVITLAANGRVIAVSNATVAGGGGSGTDQYARDTANAALIAVSNNAVNLLVYSNFFVANGNTSTFSVTTNPESKEYTVVNIDGVIQLQNTYSLSGNTIILSENVAANANVEITVSGGGGGGGAGTDNLARDTANAAFIQANAAFNKANTGGGGVSNNGSSLSGTITPLANTSSQFNIIGITGDITIAAPAGTPTEGQKLIIRLKDAGTGVNISWNVIYKSIGFTLPTTTVANKTAYIGFIYNTADADWDGVAISLES